MPNVVLNKTSGYSGKTVVRVTPETYIGKNDAIKKVIFTNAKGTTAYTINKKVNVINTYTSGATKESIDIGTINKDTNVDGWNLDAASGKVIYPANTTTNVITGIDVILSYNSNSIKLKFIQLGIEHAISVTPTLLTFESGSTTQQNVIVDSTDSWTAK